MKKYSVLIGMYTIFLFVLISCNNQESINMKDARGDFDLIGNVESVQVESFYGIYKFGEYMTTNRICDTLHAELSCYTVKFNKEGLVKTHSWVKENPDSTSLSVNEYDDYGQKLSSTYYTGDEQKNSLSNEINYNEDHLPIEIYSYSENGDLAYKVHNQYDGNRLFQRDVKTKDGVLIYRMTIEYLDNSYVKTEYNEEGQIYLVIEVGNDDLIKSIKDYNLNRTTTFSYENGRKVKEVLTEGNDYRWDTDYVYKDGLLDSTITTNVKYPNYSRRVKLYLFDEGGNWIRRVTLRDGEVELIKRRAIKYYK